MARYLVLLVMLMLVVFQGRSSHVLGGDITWTCQGGDYVFQLTFYRDCNGADISTTSVDMDVWNHPTVSQVQLNYVSRTDVSPLCTEVSGGPSQLTCGIGASGGNGLGAIEKIIYRSDPITLTGTPPAEGWIFTYQNFSRSSSITNLQNPTTYGITLASKMYAIPNSPGGCVDNSPQFLQEPYFVSCVGDPYEYNMNAVDQDLDSLAISFGHPMDHYQTNPYNPPINPVEIPYEPGFSPTSPTPGPSMNPGNVAAQLDPGSGNLTFLTNNSGSFAVKVVTKAYRQGVLIAEVEREMQLIVQNCSGTNTAPDITGPFGGLFETTVNAGDPVNFTLTSTDVELLQDGSPQNNHLSLTGLLIGPNPTQPTGCAIAPCATIDAMPLITMPQGVTTDFSWQTTCDHLVNPYGFIADEIPYHFVFKVQDDYCPIPKVSYATITINVVNPNVIPATEINCIQTAANGDLTISWNAVNDPAASFNEYQIHSVQSGMIGTESNINTTSFTIPSPGQAEDYFIAVASGCNGNTLKFSDTISNIYLSLNNPANGTAVLQWNDPITPATAGMNTYYHIYREYPAGTWTLYDSVPYGNSSYIDTISICQTFLNYQIVLPNTPCDYTSNISGDLFEDMITPDIPTIYQVSIDTITGQVEIEWNQNYQPDTYGYIIYSLDANGFVVPIDTVWGISNTTYIHNTATSGGPLTYTIAAFDSCLTPTIPPAYQTSAKSQPHTTVYLTSQLDICNQQVNLSWTDYQGWGIVDHYEIFGKKQGQNWMNLGSVNGTSFTVNVDELFNYCFVIEAVSSSGNRASSNQNCLFVSAPGEPAFNYLQVATVNSNTVRLTHYIDNSVSLSELSIQRENETGSFVEIARVPVTSSTISFTDSDVKVDEYSYNYRVQVIDSCFRLGPASNEARTILLTVHTDDVAKINHLSWNSYKYFDGSILGYRIYRGVDGVFSSTPIATVPNGQYYYEDDVNSVVSKGKICYAVEAVETTNSFGFAEVSRSNEFCAVLPPIIYIPNAFSPNDDEYNNIFIPVLSDFDPSDYEFVVFNRWGQPIFKTNQPSEGWTGIVQGTNQMAASGTYLYMVTLIDGNGIEIFKRGHVTLLK